MTSYDVTIVGGGVIGSAIAYFLMASPEFDGRVAVIEADPTYRTASTPYSCGGVRQQFSNPENIEIGLFAYHFVTHAEHYLSIDGTAPDLSWREGGYLFLSSAHGIAALHDNHRIQTNLGADIELLDPSGLAQRFPWLNVEDLAGGTYGRSGEGWLDPNSLLHAFRAKARHLGASYLTGTVTDLEHDGHRMTGLTLADGTAIACGTVVNAAGARAGQVAALAGIELPVAPRKRSVYVIDCREDLTPPLPLTIDTTGVFIRPEGGGYICGVSPPEDRDPDAWDDMDVDYHWYDDIVWPALAHRIPAFEAIKMTGAWAGWYDYNEADQNGIVGRHPEIGNFLFANGFSGHGLQQSPAVGRAVTELITTNAFQTIDLTRFAFERLAKGRLVLEVNVV